jgi:hypothetical protein
MMRVYDSIVFVISIYHLRVIRAKTLLAQAESPPHFTRPVTTRQLQYA